MDISLVRPTLSLKNKAIEYREEHFKNGELTINGSELFDKIDCYEDWLEIVTNNTSATTVNPDWVITDTFFAITSNDQKIIGIIDFRNSLNDFLKDFGHIGYSVRPSERRKGYATEMLRLVLNIAKSKGFDMVQISCGKDNIPSVKTITKNGGIYQRTFLFEGAEADIYVIRL